MPKERDLMKVWVADHLKRHPDDYWLRLFDGMFGNFRPADGVLFCGRISFMLEFKMDRRAKFAFTLDELPAHQSKSLKEFGDGDTRKSVVIVYHVREKKWHIMPFRKGERHARKHLCGPDDQWEA